MAEVSEAARGACSWPLGWEASGGKRIVGFTKGTLPSSVWSILALLLDEDYEFNLNDG